MSKMNYSWQIKKNMWFIIAVAFFIGFVIASLVITNRQIIAKKKSDSLIFENYRLHRQIDSFGFSVREYREIPVIIDSILGRDIIKHRVLIPFKGRLGGTMGFYGGVVYRLPSSNWAIAPFDDGHIGGYMLLKYDQGKDGNTKWTKIEAWLDTH
jgi:hypothetical protein